MCIVQGVDNYEILTVLSWPLFILQDYILVYVFTFTVNLEEFSVCITVVLMALLILTPITKSIKGLKFSSTALVKPILKEQM